MITNTKTGNKLRVAEQGELRATEINSIPKNARARKAEGDIIVGHSETGHHHLFRKYSGVTLFETENPLVCYLRVASDGAALEHLRSFDVHGTWLFDAGCYEIRKRREYVSAEESHMVVD